MADKKQALVKLGCLILAGLILIAGIVWFFDPFYQYHEPFAGLQAVLNDRDNQMPGTIRNFTYDSLLVGSSVAENFNTDYLDGQYHCKSIKIIRASGSMADLLYYVEMAEKKQELTNIFWCLDLFALDAPTMITLYGEDIPRYLHTESPFDDIPYLYNKEILLKKIPAMIVSSMQNINTRGNAYNWAEGKTFEAAKAIQAYDKPVGLDTIVQRDYADIAPLVQKNIEFLEEQITTHPNIKYRFIFPPYSMMWWDCAWVNGQREEKFYILDEVLAALTKYENVEIYYYQSDSEIVCNLDNYMDMVHYSPAVNQMMLERMVRGECRVTENNKEEVVSDMRSLAERISNTEIYRYYDRNGQ